MPWHLGAQERNSHSVTRFPPFSAWKDLPPATSCSWMLAAESLEPYYVNAPLNLHPLKLATKSPAAQ